MKNKVLIATLAAFVSQVIFGFGFMFTKIGLGYASPLTVIADRYFAAFVGLTIVMLIKRQKIKINKNIWKLVVMSLFQPVMYFIFESYGIEMTTSGFSAVMISLIPVVAMLSGIFILKEIPSPIQYVFTAMSVGGVVIMTLAGNADGTVKPLGVVLLLGAVISSVAYNIASRKISAEFTPFERTYAMTAIGLVAFMVIALAENFKNPEKVFTPFMNMPYLWAILYLGIASSIIAFLMLNYANTYLPVAKTTVFSNLTTVVSVISGALFMNEPFGIYQILSTVMIISGVWGMQMSGVKKREEK